jgi:hypothetical protein
MKHVTSFIIALTSGGDWFRVFLTTSLCVVLLRDLKARDMMHLVNAVVNLKLHGNRGIVVGSDVSSEMFWTNIQPPCSVLKMEAGCFSETLVVQPE